jgi:Rab proteins geranylgeranyltransferase component A
MKFLRHVLQENTETEDSLTREIGANSLAHVLASHFNIPSTLQQPLLALSLSQDTADSTNAQYAINRIKRHLRSIGIFGPGFGSMIIKYGGGAEIAQVGCRAGAVGGGVYVLGRGIDDIEALPVTSADAQSNGSRGNDLAVRLSDGERITSKYVVGDEVDLPTVATEQPPNDSTTSSAQLARSISVVSSPLPHLFPATSENGPIPAGAVVVLGGGGLAEKRASDEHGSDHLGEPPIYLFVHSSDSGECPTGQCEYISHVCFQSAAFFMMIQFTNTYLHCLSQMLC